MFFKRYTIYENKLSEQLSDDNPLKQKIIEMETPTDKHPIYSFLTIGLLIYIWIFQIVLTYQQTFGYLYSLLAVTFATICFFLTYKKSYLANNNLKYIRIGQIIFIITIFLSFKIISTDTGTVHFRDIGSLFIFFMENNNKSYLALSVLSFITLGITISYFRCTYEIYRAFYSETKCIKDRTFEQVLRLHVIFSIVFIIILPHALNLTFNPCTDSFNFVLKMVSLAFFSTFPSWFVITFQTKKYLWIYKNAQAQITKINSKRI